MQNDIELDLSGKGLLSEKDARTITELEPNARRDFNYYIENLARVNNFKGEQWFTKLSSKKCNDFNNSTSTSFCFCTSSAIVLLI